MVCGDGELVGIDFVGGVVIGCDVVGVYDYLLYGIGFY